MGPYSRHVTYLSAGDVNSANGQLDYTPPPTLRQVAVSRHLSVRFLQAQRPYLRGCSCADSGKDSRATGERPTAAGPSDGHVPNWRKLKSYEQTAPGDIASIAKGGDGFTEHAAILVMSAAGSLSSIGAHEGDVGPVGRTTLDITTLCFPGTEI